jgi:hypothetical protein
VQAHANASERTTLVATFTNDIPAAARSAVFAIGGTTSSPVPLPTGCSTASSCSVTVDATSGTNEAITVYLYASTDGSGTALAGGTTTATFFVHQATSATIALSGIIATYTASLSSNVVTVGQAQNIAVTQTQYDAAGEVIPSDGGVNQNLVTPNSATTLSKTGRLSMPNAGITYDGLGWEKPVTVTSKISGYPPVIAGTIRFAPIVPSQIGFAIRVSSGVFEVPTVYEFAPGGATPVRTFYDLGSSGFTPMIFNENATLYGFLSFGINAEAQNAGQLKMPEGTFLGYDHDGRTFVVDPNANALDIYHDGHRIRVIQLPSEPISATGDPSGDVFVSIGNANSTKPGPGDATYEFGPGTGTGTPIAQVAYAMNPLKCDAEGDLFGISSSAGTQMWRAGTFGSATPSRVSPTEIGTLHYPMGEAVDSTGGFYYLEDSGDSYSTVGTISVYYAPLGSTAGLMTPLLTLNRMGRSGYDAIAGT